MRSLAIARFRLLTTIRRATMLYVVTAGAALGAAAMVSFMPDTVFRAAADDILRTAASIAVWVAIWHLCLLVFACDAFGNDATRRTQLASQETDDRADLMDTAPIGLSARFWGEAAGIFSAAMTIHLCTLPLLVLIVALSPLHTGMFLAWEAVTVILVALASTGSAWKRRAPRSKWSATRGARSALLFLILLLMTLKYTTKWEVFRDSLFQFVTRPTPRMWSSVSRAVENPALLITMLLSLYFGYLAFYYASSVKTARR